MLKVQTQQTVLVVNLISQVKHMVSTGPMKGFLYKGHALKVIHKDLQMVTHTIEVVVVCLTKVMETRQLEDSIQNKNSRSL